MSRNKVEGNEEKRNYIWIYAMLAGFRDPFDEEGGQGPRQTLQDDDTIVDMPPSWTENIVITPKGEYCTELYVIDTQIPHRVL